MLLQCLLKWWHFSFMVTHVCILYCINSVMPILTKHCKNTRGFCSSYPVVGFTCVSSSISGINFLDGETGGSNSISNLNFTFCLKFVTSIIIPAQFWSWNTICRALKGSCFTFFFWFALWFDSGIFWQFWFGVKIKATIISTGNRCLPNL